MPCCSPSAPIRRMGVIRICSFIRGPAGPRGWELRSNGGIADLLLNEKTGVTAGPKTRPHPPATDQRRPGKLGRIVNLLHLPRRSRVVNGGHGFPFGVSAVEIHVRR